MPFQPRIAIAGAGPSGLALALLLQQRGIHPTIYERRSNPTAEELAKPSGMLDLHEESGLKVMRECGLWDDFQAAVGDCSEACRVLDPEGNVLHTDEGGIESRPEIARNSLTSILLKNVPSDCIKWNHKITSVASARNENTEATEIIIDLGEEGSATYDFVVGADGAWSRVRNVLTDVKPFYSGAQWMTATIRNATTRFPQLSDLCGLGTLMALGHGHGIMTQRGPQDSIRVYAAIGMPEEHWVKAAGLEGKSAAEAKSVLLEDNGVLSKWAPSLKELLSTACDEDTKDNPGKDAEIWPMYMLPVGNQWEHQSGVTLTGDAAHLMTPWGGEGVNLALWDSLDLAYALGGVPEVEGAVSWEKELEPRMREHEAKMLARAKEYAEDTARNKEMCLSEDGGKQMANMFAEAYGRLPIE